MRKIKRHIASWAIGLLFLGTYGLANSVLAQSPSPALQQDDDDNDSDAMQCLDSTCRSVPIREKLTTVGHKYVRGVIGGFRQGSGPGGGVQFTTRNTIPGLNLRANFLTSTKLARRVDFEAFIPRVGSGRNHADLWFSYMRMVRNFFGIGPRISRDAKTDFAIEQRSFQALFYRDIAKHWQSGVYAQEVDTHSTRGKSDTNPPIDANFSPDQLPFPSQWAPGLFSYSQIFSYGTYLLFDTRDNSHGLTQGVQIYGKLASNDGLKNNANFENYGWHEAEFDARGYIPVVNPKTSLALRSRGQFKTTKGGSQIPFYDLSSLGGREYVRGYENYRLSGENVLIFAVELRRTVKAKTEVQGIDVFAFADTGQVWGDSRSSQDPLILQNRTFNSSNWHSGVGGGIQYRRSQKLAGRFEIGHSNEGNRVYVSLSRGF